MLDAYVDCPWREQSQWWGDARIQGWNTFYISSDTRLFKRGLRQIVAQQTPEGLTYAHTPTVSHDCIIPDFTLTWLITHWDYYWQTGDISLFREMKKDIHRIMGFFNKSLSKNGLLPNDYRYSLFLDWCEIFRDGYSTLYNLFYLMALRKIISLFKVDGDEKSVRVYKEREKKLLSAIKRNLYDGKNKILYAGLSWKEKPVIQNSPHLNAFIILLDIFPEIHKKVEKELVPFVKCSRKGEIIPSPFFMMYIFEALKKIGRTAEVINCIERWWGEMIKNGFTTTIERWDFQRGQTSACHAWSAHPIVHFSNILLGIWQISAGWEKIKFSPTFSSWMGKERQKDSGLS